MSRQQATSNLLWTPGDISSTRLEEFRKLINQKYNLSLSNYHDLYEWSTEHIESFWAEVWSFCQVIHSKSYSSVVEADKSMDEIPLWFPDSRLNYAENILEKGRDEDIAVIFANEKTVSKSITYSQLKRQVHAYASSLTARGVGVGDRVVGLLSNGEHALYAYLATASIGAIWSCISTDFGSSSILERFKQIDPKVLFAVDSTVFNGKRHSQHPKIDDILNELPNLRCAIICTSDTDNEEGCSEREEKSRILLHKFSPTACSVQDFLSSHSAKSESDTGENGNGRVSESLRAPGGKLNYTQVPFSHPLCILYSSGTTGAPKCMVHSHGGTLIEHMKEHLIHGQVERDDVFLYYTTTAWMMYNWLISSLVSGCTIVLYDGAAIISRMWHLVDEIKITILGTSAKWIAMNEVKQFVPSCNHNLASLRAILSTGSPLSPQSYRWVYKSVKRDVLLGSITGGSDIISCFAHHSVTLPVYEGEIQCRGLGMAVQCYSEDGKSLLDCEGELVCSKVFPCMPVFFWNDEDGTKYRKAYFSKFKGIWCHGDFCVINSKTGGILMLGRSDGTLNPNGIRFGSRYAHLPLSLTRPLTLFFYLSLSLHFSPLSDIYNVVQTFNQIEDSVCVGQSNADKSDERVVLFVKMKNGFSLDNNLLCLLSTAIREQLSPRHVPAIILPIEDIPVSCVALFSLPLRLCHFRTHQ